MKKQEFINTLREKLSGLPEEDLNKTIEFYSEMIDDRMEDGMTEDEAVNDIGDVDEIVKDTIGDVPLTKIIKEKATSKRTLRNWEIVLLILGAPLWGSLLITALALLISFYAVLFSLIAVVFAFVLVFFVGIVVEVMSIVSSIIAGRFMAAIVHFGLAVAVAGLGIVVLVCGIKVSIGIFKLSKKMIFGIKRLIVGGDKK